MRPGLRPAAAAGPQRQNIGDLMERQTRAFMADPKNVQYNSPKHILYVSRLIKWYSGPIERDYQSCWDFTRKYLPKEQLALIMQRNKTPRLRYLRFDKSLNEAAKP